MSGELWVKAKYKRMVRLDGRLNQDVSFGFGILGRLYQGGWFSMQRAQISTTDWKTERFELHMKSRAILFKIITQEISEIRSGFSPVAARLDLVKGAALLYQTEPESIMYQQPAYLWTKFLKSVMENAGLRVNCLEIGQSSCRL